ncbi:MAG: hypothetical protein C0485_19575 [Pirellula sp.]|nr:hypothetical protein [Pirellula sp.]
MIDESLRLRLESLNRGPLPTIGIPTSLPSRAVGESSKPTKAKFSGSPLRPGLVKPIPGLLRRGEVVATEAGEHWRVCIPVEEIWPGGEQLIARRCEHLAKLGPQNELMSSFPARSLFVDLETCGLAGSALFLVGLLRAIDGKLAVELLLARNYAEEAAVLESLWQRIESQSVIVTFNGKSFDWPMVTDRSRRHLLFRGQRLPMPRHFDMLHPARRRWKKELPDCKLQTLEQRICGRVRVGDIHGNLIPAAYKDYVRTGVGREMEAILFHNAVDLVTLLDLTMRLAA